MRNIIKSFQYGQYTVTLKTGAIARQASGSVMVTMGDTAVLVAVTAKKEMDQSEGSSFNGQLRRKTYAAGKYPDYFKREGRPTEHETLVSRLIDRPIRPLFPCARFYA